MDSGVVRTTLDPAVFGIARSISTSSLSHELVAFTFGSVNIGISAGATVPAGGPCASSLIAPYEGCVDTSVANSITVGVAQSSPVLATKVTP
jgi:hypothetical protein